MTTEQLRDQEHIIHTVSMRIRKKYSRGQKEHGGNLWDRPALPELINETTDHVTYLVTLERQLMVLLALTQETQDCLKTNHDVAGALQRLEQVEALLRAQLPRS